MSLWKRVRHAYYQMPDGPVGMSEPRYASLAFEGICDVSFISNFNNHFSPINEMNIRDADPPTRLARVSAGCIHFGMPSRSAVVDVNQLCELA